MLANRIQESTTTTGTGTLTLNGAENGFRSFISGIGNNNKTFYVIEHGSEWEVGIGTVIGSTLTRDTVLESSNSNNLVSFTAGTKTVFNDVPAQFLNPGLKTNITGTFDLTYHKTFELVLTSPTTSLSLTNATVGKTFTLRLIQDSVGSRTVNWWNTIKWSQVPTLSTGANRIDWFGFVCTGVNTFDGFTIDQNLQ